MDGQTGLKEGKIDGRIDRPEKKKDIWTDRQA